MNAHAHGALISRFGLGIVLLDHSVYLKAVVYSLAGTASYFGSIGLPEALAYPVFAIEAIAGVALIVGYKVRVASLLVIPILLGATWAHAPNGWLFTNAGGGWEYPLFLAIVAAVQSFLGSGSYALDNLASNESPRPIRAQAAAFTK